jgi:hypothetical protein
MKSKAQTIEAPFILLIVGFTCIVVTSVLYENRIKAMAEQFRNEQRFLMKVSVVKCARDIPSGKIIEESDLKTDRILVERCPANAIDCKWTALGRSLPYSKAKGEYVNLDDFGFALKN